VRDIKGKLLPPLEAQPNEMSKNGSLDRAK